jgi:hypothetical protein
MFWMSVRPSDAPSLLPCLPPSLPPSPPSTLTTMPLLDPFFESYTQLKVYGPQTEVRGPPPSLPLSLPPPSLPPSLFPFLNGFRFSVCLELSPPWYNVRCDLLSAEIDVHHPGRQTVRMHQFKI